MAQIIKHSAVSQDQILDNILAFVETLPNKDEIKDQLNSSTMQVIYQLLAGMGVFSLYKYNQMRRETYLSTATMSSSIQNISKQLGYNISRANAPIVEMVYQGTATIVIKSGDVIAKYNDNNITYFGVSRFIEKGDHVKAYLGDYRSLTDSVQVDNKELYVDIVPKSRTSVDNLCISFSSGGVSYNISRDAEDYIISRDIVDFSINNTSARLYIKDDEFNYGVSTIVDGDTYDIAWLETDGYTPNLTVSNIKGVDDLWLPYSVLSYGSSPETDDKVQRLAPFYYSTMRRAVTERDYTYLCKAHSYIRDCYAQTEIGSLGKWQTTIRQDATIVAGEYYTIQLKADTEYRYKAQEGDDAVYVAEKLMQRVNEGGWATASITGLVFTLTALSAREDISPVASSTILDPFAVLNEHTLAPCCTIDIFYIMAEQTRNGEILTMTEAEQLIYAQYIENFKMAGKTIVLSPAKRVTKHLKLKVELSDRTLVDDGGVGVADYILSETRKILERDYEFQLNTGFTYAELIASVTKIALTRDFTEYQPIVSCVADQEAFDLSPQVDTYYVFDSINIDFGDDDGN